MTTQEDPRHQDPPNGIHQAQVALVARRWIAAIVIASTLSAVIAATFALSTIQLLSVAALTGAVLTIPSVLLIEFALGRPTRDAAAVVQWYSSNCNTDVDHAIEVGNPGMARELLDKTVWLSQWDQFQHRRLEARLDFGDLDSARALEVLSAEQSNLTGQDSVRAKAVIAVIRSERMIAEHQIGWERALAELRHPLADDLSHARPRAHSTTVVQGAKLSIAGGALAAGIALLAPILGWRGG